MADKVEVLLPDIGDFEDVEIIELLVGPGDRVEPEDPLITLESDKASMEIPSPRAGVVAEVKVAVGDKVSRGDLVLLLETADEDRAGGAPAVEAAEMVADAPAPDEAAEMVEDAPVPDGTAGTGEDTPAADGSAGPVDEPPGEAVERPVVVPDIGDFQDVEIIEMLVAVGDSVAEEQSLLTLESDKATMEIPAPFAGTVRSLAVGVGDKVNRGDLIATFATGAPAPAAPARAAAGAEPPPAAPAQAPAGTGAAPPSRPAGDKAPSRPPVVARPSDVPPGKPHASPGVRRFARELGVDLYLVAGSGPKGRITKEDVQQFVKRALAEGPAAAPPAAGVAASLPAMPEVDFSQFGEIEEQPLKRIKRLSGAHLHRAWLNVPHVTQFDEADITDLEAFRKAQKDDAAKADVKLTFMPFLMKAVCRALSEFPQFNSSLSSDGERLILKRYMHIGVAVDTPNGLVVPVIRDVDRKGVFELARELGETGAKARAGKLAPGDLQGGCLSISSLGGIGGTQFAPIVNAPEVAILGVSRASLQPRWDGSAFVPRLIMPFSLSYDHRVIDGAEGVRFTRYLGESLSDIRRLLL